MSKIYISGHLNPDMDSICSAYAYAHLKNKIDPLNEYEAIRCGQLNISTKRQFEKLDLTPPRYIRDIKVRLKDIISSKSNALEPEIPIFDLMKAFSSGAHSAIPVIKNKEFKGLLTIDDVTKYFLQEANIERPIYSLTLTNIKKVIPGHFYHKGKNEDLMVSILVGSMHYRVFKKRCKTLKSVPVLITGHRKRHIKYAVENQFPLIIVTGLEKEERLDVDITNYTGTIYVSDIDTAETIRMLRLCEDLAYLISKPALKFASTDLFDDSRKKLAASDVRGASVYDGDKWVGYVTRASFLDKPTQKLILVDHNEIDQSISGSEDATIVEIIDHHRFNPRKTKTPIFIASEPLGSTCSIVYNLYRRYEVAISKEIALVLLSGITSDTVMLKSPTTTFEDVNIVQELCDIAKIKDYDKWAQELFSNAQRLSERDLDVVIKSDFKIYREQGINVGIGQCEVTGLTEVDLVKDSILEKLEDAKAKNNLDWTMLLITDVVHQNSILIATSYNINKSLAYEVIDANSFNLPKVLSRKKQLLPEVIRAIEEEKQ